MKRIVTLFYLLPFLCAGQPQRFDLVNFTPPPGWKKETGQQALQFSQENKTDGSYCVIMVFKSIPGTRNAKENFDAAWESIVKEMVNVNGKPEMQPPANENGWEAQSGFASFENEGEKGIALLVTSTGFDKMVNILTLTNTNAYEKELSGFLESISLSKPSGTGNTGNIGSKSGNTVSTQTHAAAINSGFAFNTTHFDDGWTSTVQDDWVEVTKGSLKVLLHYPKPGTVFPADPEPLTNAAWDILVAPRYSSLRNYRTTYITDYNRPYLASGYATDRKTNKEMYIVFFRQGETGWIEFISPDKNSFQQYFRVDVESIRWDSETSLINPLSRMVNYNKFSVAASDFTGTWTSDFTGVQQLYHVYTGQYAGMNVNQSKETFQFGGGNTYNWKLLAVNGMVGNMKFAEVKSAGTFTLLNNWQIRFSRIEDRAKKYHAYFRCIKGARILMLLDADYPGSGIYTGFGRK